MSHATARWVRAGTGWRAEAADAEQMRAVGASLARHLRAGDVVVLDGPLGAGKTTLTQGIGAALAVRGSVTSPTFVIARRHPGPGPDLVHVDAYRLGGAVEVDDLDLDADLERAVTVVEWGAGKVEGLSEDRLEVRILRSAGGGAGVGPDADPDADPDVGLHGDPDVDPAGGRRLVVVTGVGRRWAGLHLADG